ncbi:DNA-binding MarR family transcriptional regulator [Rhizobium sp. PP-F2F-G38]|nr:DNA-binding MarR family transcriptional regulator [Rhizobium sp. PP-CC-3A-592]PYE35708.1 DNA-binding MarR family transcriptional regulator [Rhizobium sp. PP-WC-1G-195]PYE99202.1 DNA-binding MarR family transcriptional regulator [Rhizobium sp. PP-F2F-G38]TCP87234.1 DNA-binding MarR family transcriptional regulator [Rhizobium sp. PP-CC-2G-626]TCQ12623.1 DNA-binding MarR family transcriptional regulator [Rhizobium sp. PP-F2F-G36]TCQ28631.1 DNA-binding MarR family transcriptional regulator [Rhi
MGPQNVHLQSMKTTFDVSDKLFELYHRVHRLINQSMTEEGVSLARSKFLFFLNKLGPCRSTDIACALNFAPRTVTEAIDGLERDKLVARQPDPEDRRAKIVSITDVGRIALEAAEHPRKQLIEEIFSALDDEQLDQLHEIVSKLVRRTDEIRERREQEEAVRPAAAAEA